MNTKQIPKLKLFLSAMMSRLNENEEFFSGITVLYKSGIKEFPLTITMEDARYILSFMGVSREIEKDAITDEILSNIKDYDSIKIIYKDRMSELVIEGDDKNVALGKSGSSNKETPAAASVGGREYIIKENEASELLKAIGIMADNGKIKNDMIRKYNQIDRFVELISDVEVKDNLTIMDCG